MTVSSLILSHTWVPGAAMLAESLAGLVAIEANDLVVTDPGGAVQVLATDYTVTGNLRTGAASIRTLRVYPAGQVLTVRRLSDRLQQCAIPVGQPLPSKALELELDRGRLIDQEQDVQTARALRWPVGEVGMVLPGAATRAGKVLHFNLASGAGELLAKDAFKGDPGGNIAAVGLWTQIAVMAIPPGTDVIQTSGFAAVGGGADRYVNDALATLALAAAHPRACRADAGGRYWRLLPTNGQINVMAFGATATAGQNDQPAIQAAIKYAAALGGTAVQFAPVHESWQPAFPGGTPSLLGGYHISCTGNVPLIGAEGGTTIDLKNPTGGLRLKTDGTVTWASGWLVYEGGGVTVSTIEKISVKGNTVFANVLANAEMNVFDKGICMEGAYAPNLTKMDHRDLTMRNFAGEIWYRGGYTTRGTVFAKNLTLEYSPQSCWNPASLDDVWAENLVAGHSYQATEAICPGHTYIGGRFHNSTSASFAFTEQFVAGYHYSYPFFTAAKPRWLTFQGMRFDGVATIYLTSRVQGNIIVVDGLCQFLNYGRLTDINLKIEAWCDQVNNIAIVDFSGVSSLTAQVPECPVPTYYEKPSNIKVEVDAKLTHAALAAGRKWYSAIRQRGGLLNIGSVAFYVKGELLSQGSIVGEIYAFAPLPIAGSQFALVEWQNDNGTIGNYLSYPNADFSVGVQLTNLGIQPQAAGTFTMTMTNASGYLFCHGQRLRISQYTPGAGTGRKIRLPANGSGFTLKEDRILHEVSDFIDLHYDSVRNAWVELNYVTSARLRFKGSAIYDAPSIANGASVTTTVAVTGCAVGDFVDSISLGVSSAGLVLTGYVSAADTVTVVLSNTTGAAVDLASTTLAVEVRRKD